MVPAGGRWTTPSMYFGVAAIRPSLVSGAAVGTPALLELGFEDVAPARGQLVADPPLHGSDGVVVDVVELLDDLERPATVEHVAPHRLPLDQLGQWMPVRVPQHAGGVAQEEVGAAHELVERVQMPPGSLDPLEGFAQLAGRRHVGVAGPDGAPVIVVVEHG